ncbi:MAG TPA: oligosaccharide flippase family protein [Sphingomicrobium sp.]|nr:oligosaccharide flippase family protein [Sphingomicrobium sp.]
MRHWFEDRHFRSLLKNTSYLGISRAVAAVASIAAFAFTARALGVTLFGILILIHSYAQAASGITKFQSWQLIIRYGGGVFRGETAEFKAATGFAFGLDVTSAVVGTIAAIALLPLIGAWFGISENYLAIAMLYCLVLPTMAAATPTGVLRALDRFDLISWQSTVDPIARAILAGIAFAADAPFEAYVAIWFGTNLGGDLLQWFLAWRELRRRDLLTGIEPTLRPTTLPNAWRFAIHVNLTSSLWTAWGPIARLLVGGLLGPAAAALYRVASSLADSAQRPADLLARAYYPEIVRMDLRTKRPWKMTLRGAVLASFIGLLAVLIMVLGGRPLIELIFGAEFLPAYPVLMVLIIAPLLGMISFPLPSMLYALDRPEAPLWARLAGTISYFIIVAPMASQFGLIGAAASFVVAYAVMVAVLMLQTWREYRRIRTAGPD